MRLFDRFRRRSTVPTADVVPVDTFVEVPDETPVPVRSEVDRTRDEWLELLAPGESHRNVEIALDEFLAKGPAEIDFTHLRLLTLVLGGRPPEAVSQAVNALPVLGDSLARPYAIDFEYAAESLQTVFEESTASGVPIVPAKRVKLMVDLIQQSAEEVVALHPVERWPQSYVKFRRGQLKTMVESRSVRTLRQAADDPTLTTELVHRLIDRLPEFDTKRHSVHDLARSLAGSRANDASTLRRLAAAAPGVIKQVLQHEGVPEDVAALGFMMGEREAALQSAGATADMFEVAIRDPALLPAMAKSKAADEGWLLRVLEVAHADADSGTLDARRAAYEVAANGSATELVQLKVIELFPYPEIGTALARAALSATVLGAVIDNVRDDHSYTEVVGHPLCTPELAARAASRASDPDRLGRMAEAAAGQAPAPPAAPPPRVIDLPAIVGLANTRRFVKLGYRRSADDVHRWTDLPSHLDRPLTARSFERLEGAWLPSSTDARHLSSLSAMQVPPFGLLPKKDRKESRAAVFERHGVEHGLQFRLVRTIREVEHVGRVLDNCMVNRFEGNSGDIDAFATLHDDEGAMVAVVNWRRGNGWKDRWIETFRHGKPSDDLVAEIRQATDWALERGDFAPAKESFSPEL